MDLDLSNFFPIPEYSPHKQIVVKSDYQIGFETSNFEKIEVNLNCGEILFSSKDQENNYFIECGSPSVILTIPEEIYMAYFREIDTSKVPRGMEYYPSLEDFLLEVQNEMIIWVHDFRQNIVVRTLAIKSDYDVVLKIISASRYYKDSSKELVSVFDKGKYTVEDYGNNWVAFYQV